MPTSALNISGTKPENYTGKQFVTDGIDISRRRGHQRYDCFDLIIDFLKWRFVYWYY